MKIKKLILTFTLIFSSMTAISKTYVGFELCKKTSIENVIQMLDKSGAANIKIDRELERVFITNVVAEQYPVANGYVKITVGLTDDLLFSLSIEDENKKIPLLELMSDKYGIPIEVGPRLYGYQKYSYKSDDSRISINGYEHSVQDLCEKINDKRISKLKKEEEKIKNEERKPNKGKDL
jgi:hypothetical protein